MSQIESWDGHHCMVTRYPVGFSPGTVLPGDFGVVCDWHEDPLGRLIRAGGRARYGNTDAARWSHSFMVVSADGDIVEAQAGGIKRAHVNKYDKCDYILITPKRVTKAQRNLAVEFCEDEVGKKYDYLDFVGLALSLLFRARLSLHTQGKYICSALVSRATEKYVTAYPYSFEAMMPPDLAFYWDAHSHQPLPSYNLIDKALNVLVALSTVFKRA